MSNVIAVVLDSGTQPVRWPCERSNFAGFYIREILRHAGLFFDEIDRAELTSRPLKHKLALLPWDMALSGAQRSALTQFVSAGGCVLGIGGTSGLDDVFGCASGDILTTGRLRRSETPDPATAHLDVPTRVFGGRRLIRKGGRALAFFTGAGREPERCDAVIGNRFGNGTAIAIGPDVVWSVLHLQQGTPVVVEKVEGVVDVEKGMALNLAEDRQRFGGNDIPIVDTQAADPEAARFAFFKTMGDNLRELIVRSILSLCRDCGIAAPMLWYWPGELRAVAHMSHDTENNLPPQGARLFEVVSDLQLQTTWCIRYPGGYDRDFYARLRDSGFEIALHFDAQTRQEHTCWRSEDLGFQRQWLRNEAGADRIVSNKNHYLRWEGRLEFYRWCLSVGIELDETKGPNEVALNGFPFGGCHPWFPADEDEPGAPPIDVLEVNLMTQDLIVRCPTAFGKLFVDGAVERCGIAHFLFHPTHIHRAGVEPALRTIVGYARNKGMEWWTARRINAWERARRGVTCDCGENTFSFRSNENLDRASLLLLLAEETKHPPEVCVSDRSCRVGSVERSGFSFANVSADLKAGGPDLTVELRKVLA